MIIEPANDLRADAPLLQKCVFRRCSAMDAKAEEHFSKCAFTEKKIELEEAKKRISAGTLIACAMERDGVRIGSIFFSFFQMSGKKFLFCENIFSELEKNTYDEFLPALEEIARKSECFGIFAETQRPGVFLALSKLGFSTYQIQLVKKI